MRVVALREEDDVDRKPDALRAAMPEARLPVWICTNNVGVCSRRCSSMKWLPHPRLADATVHSGVSR